MKKLAICALSATLAVPGLAAADEDWCFLRNDHVRPTEFGCPPSLTPDSTTDPSPMTFEPARCQQIVGYHAALKKTPPGWQGHILLVGDSQAHYFPNATLAAAFGYADPDEVANVGVPGSTPGEQVSLYTSTQVDAADGKRTHSLHDSLDLTKVDTIVMFSNGGNAVRLTNWTGRYLGGQEWRMLQQVIAQVQMQNSGAQIHVYTVPYLATARTGSACPAIRALTASMDRHFAADSAAESNWTIIDDINTKATHNGHRENTDKDRSLGIALPEGTEKYYWRNVQNPQSVKDPPIHRWPQFYEDYIKCPLWTAAGTPGACTPTQLR